MSSERVAVQTASRPVSCDGCLRGSSPGHPCFSAALVSHVERRSTLFYGGAHDVVSSRMPGGSPRDPMGRPLMSGLIPYVEQYFPDPHDPRDPVRVPMMSGLAVSPRDSTIHATPRGCPMMSGLVLWSSGISPPTVPTPTSGAHQECFQPTAPPPGVLLSTAKGVCRSDTWIIRSHG